MEDIYIYSRYLTQFISSNSLTKNITLYFRETKKSYFQKLAYWDYFPVCFFFKGRQVITNMITVQ